MRTTIVAAVLALSLFGSDLVAAQTTEAPFTVSAEALLWWLKDSPAPVPLVSDGALDRPGTRVFLGGQDIDANPLPGFRVTAGYALSDRWGVEGSVFYLPTRSASRNVSSSGKPGSVDLRIPFFNYVNDVARPGNQIDRTVNPTGASPFTSEPPAPLTGPARPTFKFHGSDFWSHGLNVGLAFSF